MPRAYLCDFDGTICPSDIGASFVRRFTTLTATARDTLIERWRAGELGSREVTELECRSLVVSEADALAYTRGFAVDPHFAGFARDARRRGDHVMVVSEGFDFYVRDQLERVGLSDLPRSTNLTRFVASGVVPEFPSRDGGCGRCGNCKQRHVQEHRTLGFEVVLVGDGLSDRCGARLADRVIARGELLEFCRAEGIPAVPFEDFAEVDRIARDLDERAPAAERSTPGGLESMKIGPVEYDSPFMLAPLAGVSDSPFRRLSREQGASFVYTEMVSADGLTRGNDATLEYCRFDPSERPIGIQIFGSDPGVMAEAARVLCGLPEEQRPDLIDINMGCPVRKVVNRCAGAALLTNVPLAREIVSRMTAVSTVPVTAKIRLGWDGESRNVIEVSRALEDAGAAAVAIHARTRAEKFEGEAHWEMIGEAKKAVGIPVIGNGDVRTHEDAVRMLEMTGCDAVMLGRAAFGDPWVFRRLRAFHELGRTLPPATTAERLGLGLRHLELMRLDVGAERAAREMRKHVAWYIKGLPHSARVREQVNRTRTVEEMGELLRGYLEELDRLGPSALEHAGSEAAPPPGDREGDPTEGAIASG